MFLAYMLYVTWNEKCDHNLTTIFWYLYYTWHDPKKLGTNPINILWFFMQYVIIFQKTLHWKEILTISSYQKGKKTMQLPNTATSEWALCCRTYKFLILLTRLNRPHAAQYPQGDTLSFSALTRLTELFQLAWKLSNCLKCR